MTHSRSSLQIAALGALLSQSGCVVLFDGVSLLAGPNSEVQMRGTSLPVRPGKTGRAVKLDRDHGLVCEIVDEALVRATSIETKAENPNGIRTGVIFLTALEGGIAALFELVADVPLHEHPYVAIPIALDLAWGIFRSITIHSEIWRETNVSVTSADYSSSVSVSTPCPPGAEVVLGGDGATTTVHVAAAGRLEPAELPTLIAFLQLHATVTAIGIDVKFDGAAAADILAAAKRRDAEVRAQAAAEASRRASETRYVPVGADGPGPVSIPPPPPVMVVPPPGVRGRVMDFPPAALCQNGYLCPPGQRCGDRGDGVLLCFGPGAIHPFCAAGPDCASGVCWRRPDGVGVCR